MSERHTFTVRAHEAGVRLDVYLASTDAVPSRSAAQRLIAGGWVRVNGEVATKRHVVRPGERIDVYLPPEEPGELTPEPMPLDIRYEDEHLIVLAKPAGLVVHPARGHDSGTLVHALLAHTDELGSQSGEDRPGIVHRLDKDTSGLMLVAKTDAAHVALARQLKDRHIKRCYLALACGVIHRGRFEVRAPIGRHRGEFRKMAVDTLRGKEAATVFTVLERFARFTLVEASLKTGRTHQIRVHLSSIGHPVAGDPLYGGIKCARDLPLERLFLHAYRLEFAHPTTGKPMSFEDELPPELAHVVGHLRETSPGW